MSKKERNQIALFQEDPEGEQKSKGLQRKVMNRRINGLLIWTAFWSFFNIFVVWLFYPISLISLALLNFIFSISIYALNVLYATEMWQTPLSYLDPDPQGTTDLMNFWSSRQIRLLGPGFGLGFALIFILIQFLFTG